MKTPPAIVHFNYERTDNMTEIARDCAKAIHMSKGEAALLAYYGSQSSQFKPALNHIATETNQSRSQVARNRAALIKHGLAAEYKGRLYIDWGRAKIYASLDPRLTSKHSTFAPMVLPWQRKRVTVRDYITMPLKKLCERLAALLPEEYDSLRQEIAAYERRKHEGTLHLPRNGTRAG